MCSYHCNIHTFHLRYAAYYESILRGQYHHLYLKEQVRMVNVEDGFTFSSYRK